MAYNPEKAKGNMAGRPSYEDLDLIMGRGYSAGKAAVAAAEAMTRAAAGGRYSGVGNGEQYEQTPAQRDFELKHVPRVDDSIEGLPDA